MTKTQEANDIALLDLLQAELEDSIYNYALEDTEDLYDDEDDVILRALRWSVGTSVYMVVINPLGYIKTHFSMSPDDVENGEAGGIPDDLLLQVTNTILSLTYNEAYGRKENGK